MAIWLMMRAHQEHQSFGKCLLYSFTGYFYCSITPFGSGGPPMQIFYMRKEKVPIPVASVVMLIVTFLYKAVLVVAGLLLLLFGQRLISRYLSGVLLIFGVGLFLTVGFSFLLALFIFRPNLAKKAMVKGLGWLERKRFMKPKEGRRERLEASMDQYGETAVFFKTHKALMALVFCVTLAQRFCLFLATYFVYPVSYTHLDVYKRQGRGCAGGGHTDHLPAAGQEAAEYDAALRRGEGPDGHRAAVRHPESEAVALLSADVYKRQIHTLWMRMDTVPQAGIRKVTTPIISMRTENCSGIPPRRMDIA